MSLKEKIQPYILSFGLVLGLIFATNVFATDYFTDSFDTYTVNTNLAGQNSWTGANGNAVIKNTQYYSLPQSVNFGSSQIILRREVQALGSGSFQGRVYFDGNGEMNIYVRKDNSTAPACMFSINANNGIVYKDIEQWKISILTGITFKNTWNLFAINFRTSDDMAQFCVNGTCSDYALCRYANANVSFANIDGIGFKASDSIAGLAYFDNVLYSDQFYASLVNGTCGSGHNGYVSAEPTGTVACASGTLQGMTTGQNELQTEVFYNWNCNGSGGGSSQSCWATMASPVNGTCGSADGQTISAEPTAETMCSYGYNGNSLSTTLSGWTWSCYGFNNGTTDFCSATLSTAETPPDVPIPSDIPTTTECSTYTGLDNILCNIGNTIQGIFLPSTDKVQQLQTTINQVGNLFPFNYLRVISTIFSNIPEPTTGSLTMTILGNTATLESSFFSFLLVDSIRQFFTVMLILAFIFWAINYIKNFFK